jgi:RimJ/RimL family protein N-acetyltransferase
MSPNANVSGAPDWRNALPTLTGRTVTLREISGTDLGPLVGILSLADATRFNIDEAVTELAAQQLIDRARRERAAGLAFTYVVTIGGGRTIVGLAQVRQVDAPFENVECECTLVPSARGTGVFVEAARLIGSFLFGSLGTHRIEARVALQNGRANGALRKLGAVQEGILRHSMRQHGEYVDQVLWSMLREDWGDHCVATGPRVH